MNHDQAQEHVREVELLLDQCKQRLARLHADLSAPESLPPWYLFAKAELGVKELPGDADNPRIRWYHSFARGEAPDSVPWCSSFMCAAMESSGIESTRSKAARSWEGWGKPLDVPRRGCVVVFSRPPNPAHGHVALYEHEKDGNIYTLGGNQGDRVSVAAYPKERLIGYRWPAG